MASLVLSPSYLNSRSVKFVTLHMFFVRKLSVAAGELEGRVFNRALWVSRGESHGVKFYALFCGWQDTKSGFTQWTPCSPPNFTTRLPLVLPALASTSSV